MLLESKAPGRLCDGRLVAPTDDLQHGGARQVEEVCGLSPGVRVRPAHELVADHRDVECLAHLRSSAPIGLAADTLDGDALSG